MSPHALAPRNRRGPRVVSGPAEPLLQKTFYVYVEKSFRIEEHIDAAARHASVPRWRVTSDERRFLKPGDVAFELTATRSQIESFETEWVRRLELLGESEL